MANFTQPQFALPFTLSGSVTIAYNSGVPTVVTISPASALYNDRSGNTSTDAFAYVVDRMNTVDTGRTWTQSELVSADGEFIGMCIMTASSPTDGRTPTSITFAAGMTGKMFGYTSNSVSATPGIGVTYFVGTWVRQYLWIPQPKRLILMSINEKTRLDSVITTSGPDGATTRDYYGGVDRREIEILTIPAANIWQHYADDSDHAGVVGCATGDQNVAFDEFRKLWRDGLPTATSYCRFYPDVNATATYVHIEPGQEETWMGDLSNALDIVQRAPYRLNLLIKCYDMGS